MAAVAPPPQASELPDTDVEYEYDSHETETFYVDLDLSSVNGLIKSTLKKKVPHAKATDATASTSNLSVTENGALDQEGNSLVNLNPAATLPQGFLGTDRPTVLPGDPEIQILDLHSHNPIISYQNQIYSCTWTDMIGTNMFFAEHEQDPPTSPLRTTEKYNLLGVSRIKLVGHKAKLNPKKRARAPNDDGRSEVMEEGIPEVAPGKSLGNLRYTNAKINADIKKQAKFLEKLMDIKRAKGETDNVRTVYNSSISKVQNSWGKDLENPAPENQASLAMEIEKLNRRVVRGDAEALARLQEIYSCLDEETVDDELPQAPMGAYIRDKIPNRNEYEHNTILPPNELDHAIGTLPKTPKGVVEQPV